MGAISGRTIDVFSPFFAALNDDQRILAQAIFLRLNTRQGTYFSRPEYGLLLSDYIKKGLDADTLARIPSEVQAQIEQDRRIARVRVVASQQATTSRGVRLVLAITITPVSTPEFTIAIGVDKLTGAHFVRDGG